MLDSALTNLERSGALRLIRRESDPLVAGIVHERYNQFYNGVRVWGASVLRQAKDNGEPVSFFGETRAVNDVDTDPVLTAAQATSVIGRLAGVELGASRIAELAILPMDDGSNRLCYTTVAFTPDGTLMRYFMDARSGEAVLSYSETHHQSAVGTGRGVLGDQKKVSTEAASSGFMTNDFLRPPALATYDMRGSLQPVMDFLNGRRALARSDLAVDADNNWTDAGVVDAHVYAGWTYDYFFKRHNRRGLDNANGRILNIVNPVRREDIGRYSNVIVGEFFLNAGYYGQGVMIYGVGLPDGFVLAATRQRVDHFAGALDVVAHELTHGVTEFSSRLEYRNESGALNEAFSDMMAVATEFFYQPVGNGLRQADYLILEDVITPGGVRSLSNPSVFGDPDHYSIRSRTTTDNGGVHTNSGIPNHAYYLAIEGGRNRISGLTVQGVGHVNREQIERVFYRAFVFMLPQTATFVTARLATIQAARDLYGAGSPAERAITQSWDAVGVFPQPTIAFSFSPSPASRRTSGCEGLASPCWVFRVTVQETSGLPLSVTSAAARFYSDDRALVNVSNFQFASLFNNCGAGSSRIPARGTACSDLIVTLGGRQSGYIAFALDGRDDNGASLSFTSSLLRLPAASGAVSPTTDTLGTGALAAYSSGNDQ